LISQIAISRRSEQKMEQLVAKTVELTAEFYKESFTFL
jgi:hypothetical protein